MNESSHIVADTAARIFADLADPQTINHAKDGSWREPLWRALMDAGLTLAWVPEEYGGAGAEMADGFEILQVAGRFALPVPLAETLLAGFVLSRGGLKAPSGVMTVAPVRPKDRITLDPDGMLSGRARGVPFAREAKHFAVVAMRNDIPGMAIPRIALVAANACRINAGHTLAGDPCDEVTFDGAQPVQIAPKPGGLDPTVLMLVGATARSVEMAGALESVLAHTVRYANERVAFERPIAKFQAVQHNLARLAGEVAAAVAAAGSAADAIVQTQTFDDAIFLEAAAAKIRCAEAAQEGVAIAHQVHGAIGFTQEHILHRFTLRLLSWRDDFGNESHWAVELGKLVALGGADRLWPLIASR